MDKNKKNQKKDRYRFGMGIDIIDNNVLSGPDIERAVNTNQDDNESKT